MPQALIIVPCYNEAARFQPQAFGAFIESQSDADLCFVNDGSTDETAAVLDAFVQQHPGRARVMHLQANIGKAGTVRAAMLAPGHCETYAFLGYWDADLATPLSEATRFIATMNASNPPLLAIFGSRVKRLGGDINRSLLRHLAGRVFATFASLLLDLPVYDSQCGAKLFRREIIATAFADPFTTQWLFDVEILARFRNAVGRRRVLDEILELPLLRWADIGGTKITLKAFAKVPLDLLRIHLRYNGR